MASQGEMEFKDHLDHQEKMDHQDPPDLNLEGASTPGGGRVLALKWKTLRQSTQGSLEGHSTTKKEVEPITSACPRSQSTAQSYTIKVEYEIMLIFMEQNMKVLYKDHMTTMCHVLYVMCLLDQQ